MTFETALTFLYSSIAVVSIIAYAPQIYTLILSTGRSEAVSIPSWILWFFTGGITLLYSVFIIKDIPLILVNSVGFIGICSVLGLTVYNRYFRFSSRLPMGMSTETVKQLRFNFEESYND